MRRTSAIVVPNDALADLDGERPHVWVVEQGRAVRRELQLGLRGLVQTQVTAGLQAGDSGAGRCASPPGAGPARARTGAPTAMGRTMSHPRTPQPAGDGNGMASVD